MKQRQGPRPGNGNFAPCSGKQKKREPHFVRDRDRDRDKDRDRDRDKDRDV